MKWKHLILIVLGACQAPIEGAPTPTLEYSVGGKAASEVFPEQVDGALARAACEGHAEGVSRSIAAGANPNARGLDGVTPLIWVEHCGNVAGLEALLRAGADPNVAFDGIPPVVFAASKHDGHLLRLLLAHGGDPNAATDGRSWTALTTAFALGMEGEGWENYYALLEAGADINRQPNSIAEFAAAMNQYDKVAELLERGYNSDLERLGRAVDNIQPAIMPHGQAEWAARVRSMLQERGVRFPVPPVELPRERG